LVFVKLLLPHLLRAAERSSLSGTVRAIWISSVMVKTHTPKSSINLEELDSGGSNSRTVNYASSKTGRWLLCHGFVRRNGREASSASCRTPVIEVCHIQ
jgi:hypothetical protein